MTLLIIIVIVALFYGIWALTVYLFSKQKQDIEEGIIKLFTPFIPMPELWQTWKEQDMLEINNLYMVDKIVYKNSSSIEYIKLKETFLLHPVISFSDVNRYQIWLYSFQKKKIWNKLPNFMKNLFLYIHIKSLTFTCI
jgi:hypothetical protein